MLFFKSVINCAALLSVVSPALSQKIVRINALGDSITGSPGCWRALLWQKLQAAGVKNTDFVGTLKSDGCGFTFDGEHDGHGGYLATGIANANQLPGWLSYSKPDVVQMELGTNDVWNNIAPATIISALSKLVDQMRAQKSTMIILVAKITPMSPSGCSDCNNRVIALNNAIGSWAPGKSTSVSPITVVDCYSGYNSGSDTVDGVHPNSSGNTKLANCWYAPLKAAIALAGGSSAVTTTKTAAAQTTAKTTAASSGGGALADRWAQCGGTGWTGPKACVSPWVCKYSNEWYSQCL